MSRQVNLAFKKAIVDANVIRTDPNPPCEYLFTRRVERKRSDCKRRSRLVHLAAEVTNAAADAEHRWVSGGPFAGLGPGYL